MINEFANRQNMHLAVLRLLDSAEFKPLWVDQPPVAFTALAGELGPKVNGLTALIASQQAATTGFAEDKAREEQELEAIAHEISQALAGWFESVNRQADAARAGHHLGHDHQHQAQAQAHAHARQDVACLRSPFVQLRLVTLHQRAWGAGHALF